MCYLRINKRLTLILQFLRSSGCPVQNCHITRNNYNTSISSYDMVLFLAENNFVWLVEFMEKYRVPEQLFGLIMIEPPHIIKNLSRLNNKINWTIGYRADADSKYIYGSVMDKATGLEVARDSMWRGFDENEVSPFVQNSDMPRIVGNKTKMVAWFVSNCDRVQSGRMELAKAINKHIPVDVYGKCGTLSCKRGDDKCNDMLETDYKFYLSFENALCTDYITEKAFRIMKRAIIPVVYNGADVSALLPPKSYINAEDFETAKDLADHLVFLANNPKEYLKYFWWKEFYKMGQLHYSCYLCQKMNEREREGKQQMVVYEDLEKWYGEGMCRKPRIEF